MQTYKNLWVIFVVVLRFYQWVQCLSMLPGIILGDFSINIGSHMITSLLLIISSFLPCLYPPFHILGFCITNICTPNISTSNFSLIICPVIAFTFQHHNPNHSFYCNNYLIHGNLQSNHPTNFSLSTPTCLSSLCLITLRCHYFFLTTPLHFLHNSLAIFFHFHSHSCT